MVVAWAAVSLAKDANQAAAVIAAPKSVQQAMGICPPVSIYPSPSTAGAAPTTRTQQNPVQQQQAGPPRMTQWGWEDSPSWSAVVREVRSGGSVHPQGGHVLRTVGGRVPTYQEAVALIERAGGTIVRFDGPHPPGGVAGHIDFAHINYTTAGGIRSHLAFQPIATYPHNFVGPLQPGAVRLAAP